MCVTVDSPSIFSNMTFIPIAIFGQISSDSMDLTFSYMYVHTHPEGNHSETDFLGYTFFAQLMHELK